MNVLTSFVLLYLFISVAIGLYAARKVSSTGDYAVAGRSLPLYIVIATVFATWFGSETVLGIPGEFIGSGLAGVIEDPFGASMCLVLVGLFFARKLYAMKLLTIGDYYRLRYNRTVEIIVSVCIVISYLGWVAAQITALGMVAEILSDGAISLPVGMVLGAAIVLTYTLFGGMWSVALTDFFQMIIIVAGLLFIAWLVSDMAGGAGTVIAHAADNGKLDIRPEFTLAGILGFIAAALTMMLGSIPQQDVFQRVMSSRTAKVAASGAVAGGVLYFIFAFVPMFITYAASLIDPDMVARNLEADTANNILPTLILQKAPVMAQVMFFGALLSAIMSTASATLLAPSVTVTENLLRQFVKMTDRQQLLATRITVLLFTVAVTTYAWLMQGTSIYELVGNAYKVTLVGAFIPLVMGLYWQRATVQGALFSTLGGLSSWILMEVFAAESIWPPQLVGLFVSFAGMVGGSLLLSSRAAAPLPAQS
ncbi:sodium:solute symporter [Proteobacteria bacterium 005FR1]|nr:sodium:solute symporter [Proteobacteria bacterium 005FR1]